jgi:hypothetical protein
LHGPPAKKQKRCRKCGGLGHNKAGCTPEKAAKARQDALAETAAQVTRALEAAGADASPDALAMAPRVPDGITVAIFNGKQKPVFYGIEGKDAVGGDE